MLLVVGDFCRSGWFWSGVVEMRPATFAAIRGIRLERWRSVVRDIVTLHRAVVYRAT